MIARITRAVQKAYALVPSRELRRRAAKGDELAQNLYQAARYDSRLRFFLEIIIALLAGLAAYLLFSRLEPLWAILAAGLVITYLFALSPFTPSRPLSQKLARVLSPPLASVMRYLSPALHVFQPAGLGSPQAQPFYDAADLIDFLKAQTKVEGSRITSAEINRALEALTRRELLVKEIMVPKKKMVTINPSEKIGPILLSELHKSGQEFFAVKDKGGEIEGLASLGKLAAMKEGGEVADAIPKKIAYVNERWTTAEATAAFLTTKQKAFLVVDSKQAVSGIVSTDKILEKLIGEQAEDASKDYHSLESVSENNSSK